MIIIEDLPVTGVKKIIRNKYEDERGSFNKVFDEKFIYEVDGFKGIKQVNYVESDFVGSVRGMHYQKMPYSEYKLLSCLKGEIFDVLVDLRVESKTYLKYFSIKLCEEENETILIPPGIAHGYQVIRPAHLIYLHDQPYLPDYESGIRVDDPKVNIQWPLPIKKLSGRDLSFQLIDENFLGVDLEMSKL